MANNIQLAVATRNAMADAAVDLVDVGTAGTIKIYSGTQPANGDAAITGTLLATFTLSDPAFGAASNGVCTLQGTPKTTTGAASGTATHFRMEASAGTDILDGSVGTSSADLILNTTTISSGVNVEITSGSFTMPAS